MNYLFQACGSPSLSDIDRPVMFIDGKKLAIHSFDLSYETKTDKVDSGHYSAVVTGYLHADVPTVLRKYKLDLRASECTEETALI